jgi:hypothetical protein
MHPLKFRVMKDALETIGRCLCRLRSALQKPCGPSQEAVQTSVLTVSNTQISTDELLFLFSFTNGKINGAANPRVRAAEPPWMTADALQPHK